jgi:DNA-binding IclR family transcriptional regulator
MHVMDMHSMHDVGEHDAGVCSIGAPIVDMAGVDVVWMCIQPEVSSTVNKQYLMLN